ncbi:MAG TPA: plastocyanin/azurin family copper-binding protein [Solirubrobacteraceae bacterium]|jgi:plastocyanin
MRRLLFPAAGLCGLALAVVPALAADQTITTSGNRFSPSTVTVAPGEKVTIHNGDTGNHDLYWDDNAPGHPGTTKGSIGDTSDWSTERSFTASDDGKSFGFYCSIHKGSGMVGTVKVSSAPPPGTTTGGGTTTSTSTTPPPTQTTPPPGGTTPGSTNPLPPADTTAPRPTAVRRTATRKGVVVRLSLDEPATITLRLLRGARRVARKTFEVDSGAVRLKLKRKLRPGRYTIRLTLVDAGGNKATRSLSARVR